LQNLAKEGAKVEGGKEHGIKNFALTISYITFAMKPFVIVVIWKVSFNYLQDFMNISEGARHLQLAKIKKKFG
jgi:ABC-type sugar transport system permease subunit